MLFTILFGLSMDYEVFLLEPDREEYDAHRRHARRRALGLGHATARIITSAALIMISIFGLVRLHQPDPDPRVRLA